MPVFIESTISDLFSQGYISRRTLDALAATEINTVNDLLLLMNSDGGGLSAIPGLRKKSRNEMENVLEHLNRLSAPVERNLFSQFDDEAIEDIFNAISTEYKPVADVIAARYRSGDELNTDLLKNYRKVMAVVPGLSMPDNVRLREVLFAFFRDVHSYYRRNETTKPELLTLYSRLEGEMAEYVHHITEYDKATYFLDSATCRCLERMYNELANAVLSTRALNFLHAYLPGFRDLIPYFDLPPEGYSKICPSRTPEKTLQEIYAFNQQYKEQYHKIIDGGLDMVIDIEIKSRYDFLSPSQRQRVKLFIKNNGRIPLFYLIKKYFSKTEDRHLQMYDLRNGITNGTILPLEQIAHRYNLSRDWVRHILYRSVATKLQSCLQLSRDDLKPYKPLLSKPYVSVKGKKVNTVRVSEDLDGDLTPRVFTIFLLLLRDLSLSDKS